MSPITPRCFIVRHGETEWSLDGRHTGTSDIPLTKNGEKRVRATGRALIGDDRLIVPAQLSHIYVSPRARAQRTLELLDIGCHDPYPWQQQQQQSPQQQQSTSPSQSQPGTTTTNESSTSPSRSTSASVTITDRIAEWDYGEYEGITSAEIRRRRAEAGQGAWDIWRDGCPGGESPDDIIQRVDDLIREIREKYHRPVIGKARSETLEGEDGKPGPCGDVIVVGHGHILRAFAIRWIGKPLVETAFLMEAGGLGTLSYEHHSIDEPAILLGGGFVVGEDKKEIEEEERLEKSRK